MDLHHKLRRNPNWHPDSCNICGQLGHQAATCCNGTVDFKAIYGGPEHFLRKPTVYPSDVYAIQRRKKVLSMEALDRDVENWRKADSNGREGLARAGMEHSRHVVGTGPMAGQPQGPAFGFGGHAGHGGHVGHPHHSHHPHQHPGGPHPGGHGYPQQQQQPPVKKARRVVDEPDLPDGWAAAESNGKVYYFHKVTKAVQWKRPE